MQDFKTNTGHGKLLLDDSLYPEAYATNVNEQVCTYALLGLSLAALLLHFAISTLQSVLVDFLGLCDSSFQLISSLL